MGGNGSQDGDHAFDLEERTAVFGEAVIGFAKCIPVNEVTRPLIGQLVRAATSVGANYVEADDADSKKDFRFKIGLCRRESRETKHWLRMVVAAEPQRCDPARPLWKEAKELNLIFAAIRRRAEQSDQDEKRRKPKKHQKPTRNPADDAGDPPSDGSAG